MASGSPHLTKSRYLAGRQCAKRVWLTCHDRRRATPPDAATRARFAEGTEVGRFAHQLFPGGVLVREIAAQHARAALRTRELMADADVSAIFEAAFEFERVRIRVDVLERLPGGAWGLREVKSSTGVKDVHVADCAVQRFVLAGCGLDVPSVELVHVDRSYERGAGEVDWNRFFARADLTAAVDGFLAEVGAGVVAMHAVLAAAAAPEVEPSRHCHEPHECEFWRHCTRHKPEDWIYYLPRIREEELRALHEREVERIPDVPSDFPLTDLQQRVRDVARSGRTFVHPELAARLSDLGPPTAYLDFEAMNPAIPLYPGTHPYEVIPFQWSLHRTDASGALAHAEFLADGRGDPRPGLAESLLEAAGDDDAPILTYSSYESRVVKRLAEAVPDRADALGALSERIVDLLPVVRDHLYHPGFGGSFSIKKVAPALVPDFGYDDLDGVAVGGDAAAAFTDVARGRASGEREGRLRRELLAYCGRDTLALVRLHRALCELARDAPLGRGEALG